MFVFSLENKELLFSFIELELRNLGIKQPSKLRKLSSKKPNVWSRARIFQRPLEQLSRQPVQLRHGAVVEVPCFVVDLCTVLEQHVETEGLFRKAGSTVRQREIRAHIEAGGPLSNSFHEIDLANILKLFLRELPEPLLPLPAHDSLVRCHKQSAEHLLLACMLLPPVHLHTLAYVMEFLQAVARSSKLNLMPASNLAIVLTPALMPVPDPLAKGHGAALHDDHINVLQALIENAGRLGEVPSAVARQLGLPDDSRDEVDSHASMDSLDSLGTERKGRKRRSGSLTRVLNGLRRMVGGGRGASPGSEPATPGSPPRSPCLVHASASKKRKMDTPAGALSAKKKQAVLQGLPEGLLSTPVRPSVGLTRPDSPSPLLQLQSRTPRVCDLPNPQPSPHPKAVKSSKPRSRFFTPSKSRSESVLQRAVINHETTKKPRISFGNKKSLKKQKRAEVREEEAPLAELPRQKMSWGSLGGSLGRSMRRLAPLSSLSTPRLGSPYAARPRDGGEPVEAPQEGVDLSFSTSSGLHGEYEQIKTKVCELENQLNEELSRARLEERNSAAHTACFVQTAYEQTLEDAERLEEQQPSASRSTEQLARRLSKELRIRRRSSENKVARSPSARKIGSLRRRSREQPLVRTTSVGRIVRSPVRATVPLVNPRSVRRGKPNTVFSGLPQPSPASLYRPSSAASLGSISLLAQPVTKSPEPASKPAEPEKPKVEFLVPQSPFCAPLTRSVVRRRESLHLPGPASDLKKASSVGSISSQPDLAEQGRWRSAEQVLTSLTPRTPAGDFIGRPSIAELKRNAGMVLAKIRLFDNSTTSSPPEPRLRRSSTNRVVQTRNSFEPPSLPPRQVSPRWATPRTIPWATPMAVSPQWVTPKSSPPKRAKTASPRKSVTPKSASPKKSAKKASKVVSPTRLVGRSVSCNSAGRARRHRQASAHSELRSNNSLPGDWLSGKENLPGASPVCLQALKQSMSPQVALSSDLKEAIYAVTTPRGPLAMLSTNPVVCSTPQQCPTIKRPLSTRPLLASALRRTPGLGLDTPMRGRGPMTATPLRRSPRLLAMNFASPH